MIAFFVALALLSAPELVHSTGIFLSLFTDEHCSTPSTTNPSVTLGINVCAVTTGLESFIYVPVACTTGFAKAWVFTDVGCANPVDPDYYYVDGSCYAAYIPGVFPALMLTCDADADEVTPSRPTSTTTIAVGPVVNAATSTTAGGSTTTGASSAGSTTGSTTGSTGTGTGTSTSNSNATGWNSLDYGTRVGIIVAIAVGVPPIFIGLYALKRSGRFG